MSAKSHKRTLIDMSRNGRRELKEECRVLIDYPNCARKNTQGHGDSELFGLTDVYDQLNLNIGPKRQSRKKGKQRRKEKAAKQRPF
jgi:hypothetical protein